MGFDIDGEDAYDRVGISVDITSEVSRTTVAISQGDGTVKIYTTV